jgi:hypothetical protein
VSFIKEVAILVQQTAPRIENTPSITRVINLNSSVQETATMREALDRLLESAPGRFHQTRGLLSGVRSALDNPLASAVNGTYNSLNLQLPRVANELRDICERSREFVMQALHSLTKPPPNTVAPMTEREIAPLGHPVSDISAPYSDQEVRALGEQLLVDIRATREIPQVDSTQGATSEMLRTLNPQNFANRNRRLAREEPGRVVSMQPVIECVRVLETALSRLAQIQAPIPST